MDRDALQQRFAAALDSLVARLRADPSVAAAILCGSLSHDTVWEKSDIDLVIVTVDGKPILSPFVALTAEGVNIHASVMTRTDLRRTIEGALRHSFSHSLLAHGRLLYTHDPPLADLFATLTASGARDRQIQLLRAATHALPAFDKARKWLETRGDLEYAALWTLYTATPLAQIEVIAAGHLVGREVILQARALNPAVFDTIYTRLLNEPKSRPRVEAALDAVGGYLAARTPLLFAPLVEHLREAGETRSSTEIETHFARHFGFEGVVTACEYLADRGLIGRGATPVRLTRASRVDLEELAFFYTGDLDDGA